MFRRWARSLVWGTLSGVAMALLCVGSALTLIYLRGRGWEEQMIHSSHPGEWWMIVLVARLAPFVVVIFFSIAILRSRIEKPALCNLCLDLVNAATFFSLAGLMSDNRVGPLLQTVHLDLSWLFYGLTLAWAGVFVARVQSGGAGDKKQGTNRDAEA